MMKRLFVAAAVLVASAYEASDVHAETTVTAPTGQVWWSTVASGCILDTRSPQPAAVDVQAGTVSFLSGQTGTILLSCPVTVPAPSTSTCMNLELSAAGPEASVTAYLNYLPWASPGVNIANVFNLALTVQTLTEEPWPIAYLPANSNLATLWFAVEITRPNTNSIPTFYGLALAKCN